MGSELYVAINGPEHAGWTSEVHMAATLADLLGGILWVLMATNAKSRIPKPKQIERPGDRIRKRAASPVYQRFAELRKQSQGVTSG